MDDVLVISLELFLEGLVLPRGADRSDTVPAAETPSSEHRVVLVFCSFMKV